LALIGLLTAIPREIMVEEEGNGGGNEDEVHVSYL
jgi:hypothetical protein